MRTEPCEVCGRACVVVSPHHVPVCRDCREDGEAPLTGGEVCECGPDHDCRSDGCADDCEACNA